MNADFGHKPKIGHLPAELAVTFVRNRRSRWSGKRNSRVSSVFVIIGTVHGRIGPFPKMIVRAIFCSRLVLSPGRKTHASERLAFHSRAGRNSWVSRPRMAAVDDRRGRPGRGVTGPILKAAAAWSLAGVTGRSLGERRRTDKVSSHASCRGGSEFTSYGRFSRLSDAGANDRRERVMPLPKAIRSEREIWSIP